MKFTDPEDDKILLEEFYRKHNMSPPDLEDIIRDRQAQVAAKSAARGSKVALIVQGAFAASAILLAGSIFAGIAFVNHKLERAEQLLDHATVVMDKLPDAISRTEKLLDRTDESVQRGVTLLKNATPEVSKGLVDGIRRGLNKDPQ